GTSPSSGINKLPFQNALQSIRALRPASPSNAAAVKPPLLIVGPSFSGSLESLHAQLTAVRPERDYSEILVYSGSTTNRESEESFKEKVPQKNTVPLRCASYQQNHE